MKMNPLFTFLIAVIICFATSIARPQQFELADGFILGVGETELIGGDFSVTGAATPFGPQELSGAEFMLVPETPGFFPPHTAAPWLSVSMSGAGLVFSWPAGESDFELEQTGTLSGALDGAAWTRVPNSPALIGGVYQVIVAASEGMQFFRLRLVAPPGQ
jgi:hypothetical protein